MKFLSLVAILLVFSGCAGRIVQMENDTGELLTCEVSTLNAIFTGVLIRDSIIDRCIERRERLGYDVIVDK